MKRLTIALWLLTCGVNALGFPYNVNIAAVKSSQVSGTWTNFSWTMNSGSDQSFIFHTDEQGISTAYLRFGVDASDTNYPLEWQSTDVQLTSTGSVFQGYLSRTSIPPERVWYAEFMGVLGTNSVDAGMTLGRGRINVTASLFNDANYVTQIVQQITSRTNETDPIYLAASTGLLTKVEAASLYSTGTLVAASLAPYITGAESSNQFYLASNPSGYVSEVSATGFVKKTGGVMSGNLSMSGGGVTNVNLIEAVDEADLIIRAGYGGVAAQGGDLWLMGGDGVYPDGTNPTIRMIGNYGGGGNGGGDISIVAGGANGEDLTGSEGGSITLTASAGGGGNNAHGGDIVLTAGGLRNANDAAASGDIILTAGTPSTFGAFNHVEAGGRVVVNSRSDFYETANFWDGIKVRDASSNTVLTITSTNLKYGVNSFEVNASGDISQASTNNAALGVVVVASINASGLTGSVPAAVITASSIATGTPIYSVAGLATGTPIYSISGLATGTPIYSIAGLATGTPIYSLSGYATSGAWNASVAGASNAALGVGVSVTNLHLAQGVQITNLQAAAASLTSITLTAGANITSATTTANAAVPWLSLTGAVEAITITNTANWSTKTASQSVNAGEYGITNLSFINLYNTNRPSPSRGDLFASNNVPYFVWAAGTAGAFYGPWNFSPSSYWTVNSQGSYVTNALKLYEGSVTQNQVSARNQVYYSGTNLWIGLGGTNWLYFGGVLNVHP